jgi:Tol biopolymer transport system component
MKKTISILFDKIHTIVLLSRLKTILLILVLSLGLIASVANADFTFGTPTNLGPPFNTSYSDQGPNISADGLELYFCSGRPGGSGNRDLWVATRPTASNPWGEPVNLGPTVNSSASEWTPSISADGLELFFFSGAGRGGRGSYDLWVTTRATKEDDWGNPVNLGSTVNSSAEDWGTSISADGLSLFFSSNRPGGSGSHDLWVTTRATTDDPWGTPVNLGPTVNSSTMEIVPRISADGRTLFFSDYETGPFRPGGYGGQDIWVTTRATVSDPWIQLWTVTRTSRPMVLPSSLCPPGPVGSAVTTCGKRRSSRLLILTEMEMSILRISAFYLIIGVQMNQYVTLARHLSAMVS